MSEARHIKYIALAHDGKILASYLHWDKDAASSDSYESVLGTIFESPGWSVVREQKKNKLELKSGANVYCMEIDSQGRTYIAVITRGYPIRHVFSSAASTSPKLMAEFATVVNDNFARESISSAVGGLKKSLKPHLISLASRFDDLDGLDKLAVAQAKLASLQSTMVRTVQMADERQTLLSRLDNSTEDLALGARSFSHRTGKLQRRACCGRYSLPCIIFTIIAIILIAAGAIVGVNYTTTHWWS